MQSVSSIVYIYIWINIDLSNCFEVGKKNIFHFTLFCIPNCPILKLCISKQNNVYINKEYKYKCNIRVWLYSVTIIRVMNQIYF